MTRLFRRIGLAALLVAARLGAQATPPVAVRVHVTDSLRAPIAGAEATLERGDSVVARARTDSTGVAALNTGAGEYDLVVRRVGYDFDRSHLSLQPGGGARVVEVKLTRLVQRIGPVVISDSRLPLDKQPYIAAAEIAANTRSILSLDDVISKLRANINYQGRKCLPLPRGGPVAYPMIPRARFDRPLPAVVYVNGRRVPREWNPWDSIHAGHIQEIQFVTCNDGSVAGLPKLPWPAVYVVLKPGYAWDANAGSHLAGPDDP